MPTPRDQLLIDIEHWRRRAEEARSAAERFHDPVAKRSMADIGACYDFLVEAAEHGLARASWSRRRYG
jgi:hypothetical protein